jgi:hypothetical protein
VPENLSVNAKNTCLEYKHSPSSKQSGIKIIIEESSYTGNHDFSFYIYTTRFLRIKTISEFVKELLKMFCHSNNVNRRKRFGSAIIKKDNCIFFYAFSILLHEKVRNSIDVHAVACIHEYTLQTVRIQQASSCKNK